MVQTLLKSHSPLLRTCVVQRLYRTLFCVKKLPYWKISLKKQDKQLEMRIKMCLDFPQSFWVQELELSLRI